MGSLAWAWDLRLTLGPSRSRLGAVVVLLVLYLHCFFTPLAAIAEKEEFEWLRKPITRDRNCEVCQMLIEITSKEVIKKLPTVQKHVGALDFVIHEVLNADTLCTYHLWLPYEESSEEYRVHDLTATCKAMLEDAIETVEDNLAKGYKEPEKLTEKVCVKMHKYCKNVWTEADQPSKREKRSDRNKRLAAAFMEWNKKQEGVKETPSGLQYKKLEKKADSSQEESTLTPGLQDTVTVHYRGKLLNGVEFDSSYKRNEPSKFPLNQVVPGWTEGLQLMHIGDTFELYVPPSLGYGEHGTGKDIGPNEMLVFTVELLKLEPHVVKEGEGNGAAEMDNGEQGSFDPLMMSEERDEL